jgi:putative transposase
LAKVALFEFMPRSRNIYSSTFPYHVTARTNDKKPFECTMDEAWNVYTSALWFYSRACNVKILAFVLMKNHFHLIVRTPNSNLSEFMKLFMKKTSDDIRSITGSLNHLYGNRYYPSLIQTDAYFRIVLKYVFQNPIRAGISQNIFDYPYSSLRGMFGFQHCMIPSLDALALFENPSQTLIWLNAELTAEKNTQISQGLRVQTFKPGGNKSKYLDSSLIED